MKVYSSTEGTNYEEKYEFYGKLEDMLRNDKRHDLILLMGDFKAKVGNH